MDPDHPHRPKGLSTLPTSEIALAPEFLEGVKKIAPKRKFSKVWFVVVVLAIAGGGWFAWKRYGARFRHVESPVASAADTTTATASVAASTTANGGVEPAPSASDIANANAAPSVTASVAPSAAPSASTAAPVVKTVKVRRRGPATR